MIIKKTDAKKFTIPGGTEGKIYPSDKSGDFTIAQVTMDGRYPEKGYSLNDICKESLFLLSGKLEVEIEKEKFFMGEGDLVTVEPGKMYRIKGKGEVLDLITPAWEKNNNMIIEK